MLPVEVLLMVSHREGFRFQNYYSDEISLEAPHLKFARQERKKGALDLYLGHAHIQPKRDKPLVPSPTERPPYAPARCAALVLGQLAPRLARRWARRSAGP